jgi:hypothetical protein
MKHTVNQEQPMGVDQNVREKRTLSDTETELIEAAEMDKDPTTRVAMGSVSKKVRKAVRHNQAQSSQRTILLSNQQNDSQIQQPSTTLPPQQEYQYNQTQRMGHGSRADSGSLRAQRDLVQVSNEARQFANTRYPFSPFSVTLQDDVRDKIVVEHLVQIAKDKFDFTLEIAGYRRTTMNGCFKVLIFVKSVNSFTHLLDKKVWPDLLFGKAYTLWMPNIPPQLSLVLPFVPFKTDMQELTADIQLLHPEVVNVIRLKNRNQQMIKAVKLEVNSDKVRKHILASKKLLVGGISYQVVEYMAQAHVLICSQCMGIGHFRKNCPQQQEQTCNICGDKSADSRLHKESCTGINKCIHCGGDHKSNDSRCPKIKDYRAALTKSLLANRPPHQEDASEVHRLTTMDFPPLRQTHQQIDVNRVQPVLTEHCNMEKIDQILGKLELIQTQMATFSILIEEKTRKDEATAKKLETIEQKTASISEDLSTTQTVLLQVIELLKGLTTYPAKGMGEEFVNNLNRYRNTLLNALMKPVPDSDISI